MGERRKPMGDVSAEDLHAAISTFLTQAVVFSDASASEDDMRQAGAAINQVMPTLRKSGMMRVFRVKNTKLRAQLTPRTKGAGKAAKAAARGAEVG